ncbi:MAG: AraC family transcriptional regulator [Salinisphaeraceae bacterium]|nr:AraC family transcriptional regulator [Salinisphaeraceae bacterium]
MSALKDQLYLWNGLLLYAASGHRNDWHSHYAASLIISLDAPFRLELREGVDETLQGCILAPNAENRVHIPGRFVSILADGDSSIFEPLAPLLNGKNWAAIDNKIIQKIKQPLLKISEAAPDGDHVRNIIDDCIETITGQRPRPLAVSLDRRISQVLRLIREALPAEPDTDALAEAVELSRSRLLHLFKEQLGLPMGQYILWLRLFNAAKAWDEGQSITEAAHAAGFYDQSHYTRTMRKMLDITPSTLTRNPQLEIHRCWEDEHNTKQ